MKGQQPCQGCNARNLSTVVIGGEPWCSKCIEQIIRQLTEDRNALLQAKNELVRELQQQERSAEVNP